MKQHLIIFTRYPEAGKCKTRLIPSLGVAEATRMHIAMTRFTLDWAIEVRRKLNVMVKVVFAGGNRIAMQETFGSDFQYAAQCEGDLGRRIRAALLDSRAQGAEKAIVVGADCPQLQADICTRAFAALGQHDVCLAPATDGGYTLLGLKLDANRITDLNNALFQQIPWGTGEVFIRTVQNLARIPAKVRLLASLSDVDSPDDLWVWEQAWAGRRMPSPQISVIVPVKGPEPLIERALRSARAASVAETIVVAADTCPNTLKAAARQGAQLIVDAPPRSNQMNLGADIARGEILLFLHADSKLPEQYWLAVNSALQDPQCAGGSFRLEIETADQRARYIERGVAWRSKWLRLPYGDQGLFVRAEVFRRLGGYRLMPIMEDYDFVRRLQRHGRLTICDSSVQTSARRWKRLGFVKTTLLNQLMVAGYWCGISPDRLARLYRSRSPARR